MRVRNRSEEGVTLVIVIFVGAIIMLLAFAIAMLGILETKSYAYVEQDTQAYYICKSAAEAMVAEIIDESADINNTADNLTLTTDEFDGVQGMTSANGTMNDGTYNVYASIGTDAEGNYTNIYIDSYATYADQEENLRLVYNITADTDSGPSALGEDMALFINGSLSVGSQNAIITGNVSINATEDDSDLISLKDFSSIDGTLTICYPEGEDAPDPEYIIDCKDDVTGKVQIREGQIVYEIISIPDPPAYDFPDDEYYDYYDSEGVYYTDDSEIDDWNGIKSRELQYCIYQGSYNTLNLPALGNNISLDSVNISEDDFVIYVGDEDCTIVTEEFDVTGSFSVSGTGTLTVYVKTSIGISGNLNYEESYDPTKLTIYYYGNENIIFESGESFSGTLYTYQENTDIKILIKSNARISGAIITAATQIDMNGCALTDPLLLYAPDATLEMVGNKDTLNGMVIVQDFSANTADISYSEAFVKDDPEASAAYLEYIESLIPANQEATGEMTYTFTNPIWEDNNP
jgi:hypothetical protein